MISMGKFCVFICVRICVCVCVCVCVFVGARVCIFFIFFLFLLLFLFLYQGVIRCINQTFSASQSPFIIMIRLCCVRAAAWH